MTTHSKHRNTYWAFDLVIIKLYIYHYNIVVFNKSGWPSGLRRQTQGLPSLLMTGIIGNSGPRMRAWVRIPLLTNKHFLD